MLRARDHRGGRRSARSSRPFTPPVLADPVQLEQVLLNLAVNALRRDAGGRTAHDRGERRGARRVVRAPALRCAAGALRLPARHGQRHRDGPATRERIFEPFFTTKAGGARGSACRRCTASCGRAAGTSGCTASRASGSTFKVYLPVATGEVTAAEDDAPGRWRALRRHGNHPGGRGRGARARRDAARCSSDAATACCWPTTGSRRCASPPTSRGPSTCC